jgi:hypothetical protein
MRRTALVAFFRWDECAVSIEEDAIPAEWTRGRMEASKRVKGAGMAASHFSDGKTTQNFTAAHPRRSITFLPLVFFNLPVSTAGRQGTASLDIKDAVGGTGKGSLNPWTQERLAGMST